MVILSVSIYVTAAGCGAAETPFFFSLTIELTAPWQPSTPELTSVKVPWHPQNPSLVYFPLAFFSISDTVRAGSSLHACAAQVGFAPRRRVTERRGLRRQDAPSLTCPQPPTA